MTSYTLAGLFLVTTFLGAAPDGRAMTPRETLAAFHDALSSGDRARAAGLLAPGVAIYEAGHVEHSREEYANMHLGGDIEFARSSTRKLLQQTERIDGNTAVVWDETETTGVVRGQPVRVLGTGTAILERNGPDWSIIHIHWSSRKAN